MKVEAPCGCVFDLTPKTVREQRWFCPVCNEFLDDSEEPVRIYECSHDGCGTKYSEDDGSQSCCPDCNRPMNRKINDCGHASCADEEECEKVTAVQCPVCESWCREDELTKGVDTPVTTKAGRKQKQQDAVAQRAAEQQAEVIEVARRVVLFTKQYGVEVVAPAHVGPCSSASVRCFVVHAGCSYMTTVRTWTRPEAERLAVVLRETSVDRHQPDFTVEIDTDTLSLGIYNLPEYPAS
jgi:hypothetical protein